MQRFSTAQLFALCVLVWGTTWHAITWQLDALAPEWGVALRFAFAGGAVLASVAWRRTRLAFGAADHAWFALQGVFMYGVAYVCVYQAERFVASGLVAVGYSASPLLAGLAAKRLFGQPIGSRFVAGGALGIAGVALIFWPELVRPANDASTLGALLTVGAVLLSTVGSVAASRNRGRGLPLWPALGFGMLYGALAAAVAAIVLGRPFAWPTAPSWWIAFVYLALAGSVLAFASFLTLQERVGLGPAGTVGVMTPLLALAVSVAFEGFRPDALTAVGAALAVAGNLLMLRGAGKRRLRRAVPAAE